MSSSYSESKSLAFRANLAKLVSPLRRVRSRTPFFHLAAHRIPTLWSLYRGLLRNSPTEDVKFRVRLLFHQNRQFTGVEKTLTRLKLGYKWLDFFKKAKYGDERCQNVVMRFSSLIAAKREKARMMRIVREELEWQEKLRHRPILSGGFMRPTVNHGPLPRMKPQPPAISHLIIKRLKKRELRHDKRKQLEDDLEDLAMEQQFEEGLRNLTKVQFPTVFSGPGISQRWKQPIVESIRDISKRQQLEYVRAETPFSPELFERIIEARREKIRNKTQEKDRERHGELTKSAIKRQRKGPPAHILAKMTAKEREMDKISRSLSEVGYVALVKRRLGFKLKDPDAGLELGEKNNRPLLRQATHLIHAENRRRQIEEQRLTSFTSRTVCSERAQATGE
ncbi:hypothetical protein BDZ97DRAFT_1830936 [Flammula alnicola]|nr:hypothetical protein BDZ97DRAFT_1830936 [Flammula alnicola]